MGGWDGAQDTQRLGGQDACKRAARLKETSSPADPSLKKRSVAPNAKRAAEAPPKTNWNTQRSNNRTHL